MKKKKGDYKIFSHKLEYEITFSSKSPEQTALIHHREKYKNSSLPLSGAA